MGINELKLTPELIASWYPETLVAAIDTAPPGEVVNSRNNPLSKTPVVTFLGKNLRSLCILVESPDDEFMPENQKLFLQKILAACRYSLDDIAIVNTCRYPVTMEILKNELHPEIIFFWGSLPDFAGLPKQLPELTLTIWENTKLLYVARADFMSRDSPEAQAPKRKLWNTLQKMFNL